MKSKFIQVWRKRVVSYLEDPLLLSRWVMEFARQNEQGRVSSWVNGGYKTFIDGREDKSTVHMFLDDLRRAMPYHSGFKVSLTKNDPDLERIIADALAEDNYSFDLDSAVENFIRDAAQYMTHYAEAYYEIVVEKDENGKITRIYLYDVYPPSMLKIFGQYLQVIPWRAAKYAGIKAGVQKIPKEKIIHIHLPQELGGKRGIKEIIKRLAILSEITPDFYMKALMENKSIGFNLDAYLKESYIGKAIVTKRFGWDQRDYRDENILEYYSLHRKLVAASSLALIRRHIIAELNVAIRDKIHVDAEIRIEGLPTEETIHAERQKLEGGKVDFNAIRRRIGF